MSLNARHLGLRFASSGDAPKLAALINRAFTVERAFLIGDRVRVDHVEASLNQGTFLVIDSGTDLQGAVFCEVGGTLAPATGRIGMLSVDPALQGRGLGRNLIEAAEDYFRKRGCVRVELRMVDRRVELLPFYRKFSYREDGSEPFPDDSLLRMPCRLLRMSKTL